MPLGPGSGDPDVRPDGDPREPAGAVPHVPLVLPADATPADELPELEDGRRARAVAAPAQVSPLRALAGAGLAVAGVALGIGALLSVTGTPDGSPVLEAQAGPAAEESLAPEDLAPAVEPPVAAAAPTAAAASAPAPAAPTPVGASAPAPAAPAPVRAAVPAQPPAQAQAAPQARRRSRGLRPPVAVLNNSTRPGLADRASARFARNGWPVSLTGNFRGRLRATTVYYEPGQQAAAQRFASTFRGISRVLARPANIPGPRGLVVVLTRDFPA